MSNEERVSRLLDIIMRLSKLLQRENEKLRVPGRTEGLQEESFKKKEVLSLSYEQQLKALEAPETETPLSPDLKARLIAAGKSLTALMDENKRRIEAKLEATKRVFQVIAEAAREYRAGSAVYGRTGAIGADSRKAFRPAVSVGVNREL